MKKALIFDQYLDTLGGGERYALSFGIALAESGFEVEFAWREKETLVQAKNRFNLDTSNIGLNASAYEIFSKPSSVIEKYNLTKQYDLVFWVSDGSLPFLFSAKNLVHFQVPFKRLGGNVFSNFLKNFFIKKYIYNSKYTKKHLEKSLPASNGVVLYPPVDIESLTALKKQDVILSVARFDSPLHSKRHDVLIEAFKQFYKNHKSYKLILAGGLMGDSSILSKYKSLSKGLPVEFVINPSFSVIKKLYATSRLFWHVAGYEVDEDVSPESVEHFGITTVESMASGCIPFVINKGGQKEILENYQQLLCEDIDDLVKNTNLILSDTKSQKKLISSLTEKSRDFSLEKFYERVKSIIK